MSDRLSPANGKRDVFWGTLKECGVCGRCLCYACHPRGPCADERVTAVQVHPSPAAIAASPLEVQT